MRIERVCSAFAAPHRSRSDPHVGNVFRPLDFAALSRETAAGSRIGHGRVAAMLRGCYARHRFSAVLRGLFYANLWLGSIRLYREPLVERWKHQQGQQRRREQAADNHSGPEFHEAQQCSRRLQYLRGFVVRQKLPATPATAAG